MKRKNKKTFLLMIVSILAVVVVGTVSVTYAWFLSRYEKEYDFVLESDSPVIIKYEADLAYASGNRSTATNVLIPATEKKAAAAISQGSLTPLQVFDVDVADPAHTGAVASAAQAVKYTASGAYWTGEGENIGAFTPQLHAYKNTYLSSAALTTHLATFSTESSVTEDNLLAVLAEEAEDKANAADRLLVRNDLVGQGEIDYILVINYLGVNFLYFDGAYYVRGVETDSVFTLPAAAESNDTLRYWHTPTAENNTISGTQISDGTYFHLRPNTTFSFTMYVFMAKTDEKRDPAINDETLSIFASLTVEEVTQ